MSSPTPQHAMTVEPDANRSNLDRLLAPSSVVVIGASETRGSIGSWIHRNMQRAFEGPLYAVNPRAESVYGSPTFADVLELPTGVDMAVAVVPAPHVVATIEKCAERGIGGVVVLTSGFSESGEEGRLMQERIAEVAEETGVRVVGPNCIGYMNVGSGVMANFALFPEQPMPPAGPVALVSQSGGFGSYITTKSLLAGLPLGWFVSTGNEVDVNVAQVIENLVERDDVKVILACCESLRDPESFIAAAKRADELDKPILLLKMGRSDEAAEAAMSHTASVVGSAEVLDAVCEQYGVIIVDTMEELLDLGMIFQNGRRSAGNRIGIMTTSGGAGVLMTDCAVSEGLTVPPLKSEEAEHIESMMPTPFYGSVQNPVDTTAQITAFPDRFKPVLNAVMESPSIDAFTTVTWAIESPMNDAIVDEYLSSDKPFALLSTAWMELFQRAGLPTYTDPQRAIHALGALARYSQRDRLEPVVAERPAAKTHATEILASVTGGLLLESDAKRVVADYGIKITEERLVGDVEGALEAARAIGGDVALKVMSYQLPHKSDFGAIRLGLSGDEEIRSGYHDMMAEVARKAPEARIEGVLVEQMVPARIELTCGVLQDPVFGPMVSVGLGGILIEVIAETTLLRPPFSEEAAVRAIGKLAGGRLVSARRGLSPEEVREVAQIVVQVGHIALTHPEIAEIDVNPIRVDDGQAIAADALIVLDDHIGGVEQ